ncbi:Uncharacterised protein [Mycobacteroides abscessus]|nr:Uncharacterised protein [Mycobacteroides abscessus]SHT36334.1 Uncharacterised protein [Mycobacteroides abscessus subsp. abscessus]
MVAMKVRLLLTLSSTSRGSARNASAAAVSMATPSLVNTAPKSSSLLGQ